MECITEHPAQSETLSEAASEVRLVYEVFQKREVIPDPIPKADTRLIEMEKQRSDTTVATSTNTNGVNGRQISEKEWRKDSCILVMGSVKAGKSTTINLYTGNTAETGLDNRISAETAEISFYEDKRHIEEGQKCPYPIWMDTPG